MRRAGDALAPGNVLTPLQPLGRGTVRGGGERLTASVGDFAAMIPAGPIPLLPIAFLRDVELRFDLGPDGLRRGELGGWFHVEDGVTEAAAIMPGIEETVRSVLVSIADIRPTSDPAICEGVSVGMTFEAVPATLLR